MLGQHLVLVPLHRALQLILNKTIRIGDTKYHSNHNLSGYYSNRSLNQEVWPDFKLRYGNLKFES